MIMKSVFSVTVNFFTVSSSRKHVCVILDPIKPHFYIEKMGFAKVYIIFLISAIKPGLGYPLELPR